MQARKALHSLCFAAALAALPGAAATAADAVQKNAAIVGEALAAALNARDVDAFMQHVDTGTLVRIVLKDLGLGERDTAVLREQLPNSVRKNIASGMRALDQGKASVRFMRAGKDDGKAYAIVRIDMGEGGLDYVKYFLSPRYLVEDCYVYTSAALFTTQVRFNLATMLKSDSLMSALFGVR